MPYQKRKSRESYGLSKPKRLKQLQLARDAKRVADESAASSSTATIPAPGIQRSTSSTGISDSDKEVVIDDDDTYLRETYY